MDKELLLKPRLEEDEIDVPGVGSIRVRALSRDQAIKVQNAGSMSTQEAQILMWGVVDPVLTMAEVVQWMEVSPAGEIERISQRIAELSGMAEGSAKAAYKSDGDGSDA